MKVLAIVTHEGTNTTLVVRTGKSGNYSAPNLTCTTASETATPLRSVIVPTVLARSTWAERERTQRTGRHRRSHHFLDGTAEPADSICLEGGLLDAAQS
jgi:hypothetical protein